MSLLVLMFHRAQAGRHGNTPEMLDAHFAHIAKTYPTVLPGDPLQPGALNVCLTFDDGYFDFYATVLPLLKKHGLRALLAVPAAFPCDRAEVPWEERLKITADEAFANPDKGGFCTWPELAELAASGRVKLAAHGLTHRRLDQAQTNPAIEVDRPKTIIEARVGQPVDSFVFPFGRYSRTTLQHVRANYRYAFRIGGALNFSWDTGLLYRVDADKMSAPDALFSPGRLAAYRARYFWNRLRGR